MKAFASSFGAWRSLEEQEGVRVPHGLVFPLAVVEAIGRPHGLELVAEEHTPEGPGGFDAVFISVLDSRCMLNAASSFAAWKMPLRRRDRGDAWPLVWAGGQGLHNPLPMAEVFDLCVIGDAEEPLPVLLGLWDRHGGERRAFLAAAATVPGVFVPSIHDRREVTIRQAVSADIGITLRNSISVSHDGTRRLEIARGCQYKCAFCSLGWRTPVRENPADAVTAEIARSPKRVHLQAGDAESHSGIEQIRETLRAHGGSDSGWTGRLDSLFENPDQTIPGQKRYAFGVEGVSYRLRRAVGKGYLTDDRLIDDTVRFFRMIADDLKGRAAWHIIAGLPTERPMEAMALGRVVREIDNRMRGGKTKNLALHWQPFQPLPGTPMQWCPAGRGARKMAGMLTDLTRLHWVTTRHVTGRTDDTALICSILVRSDERGANLLEALGKGPVDLARARALTGTHEGQLDPDVPLPWDFVETQHPRETLRRAYDVMVKRLAE